jgi:hypothetical protein
MARAAVLMELAILSALLLAGCATKEKPQGGLHLAVLQTEMELAGQVDAKQAGQAAAKAGNGTCSLEGVYSLPWLGGRVYAWTVHFSGFSPGDKITWLCGNERMAWVIVNDSIWGMPAEEKLSCSLPDGAGDISVSIGGVPCGTVAVAK